MLTTSIIYNQTQENPARKMTPFHHFQLSGKYKYLYHAGFHVTHCLPELNSSHTATCTNTKSLFFPTSKKIILWGEGRDMCFLLIFIILLVTGGMETNLDPTGEILRKSK
jgi:hypothetical protein